MSAVEGRTDMPREPLPFPILTHNRRGGLKPVFICWSPDLEVRITLDEEVPGQEENAPTAKGLAK
jgi:hypothetical protein